MTTVAGAVTQTLEPLLHVTIAAAAGLILMPVLVAPPVIAASQSQEVGAIQGTLRSGLGPTKRWASRYAGGGASSHGLQDVPAVAFLAGDVGPPRRSNVVVDMVQRDTIFDPGAITILPGTVVRFPNQDPFFHNVFSFGSTPRFDLGRYPEGESREVRFDTPGIVKVYCEVHEYMRAVILVTSHPFHAVVQEDGQFRIDGVPPGEYTLAVYHPDLGILRESVTVTGGQTTRLGVGSGD